MAKYTRDLIDMKNEISKCLEAATKAEMAYSRLCDHVKDDPEARIPSDQYMLLMAVSTELIQFAKSARDELDVINNAIKQIKI